MASAQSDVTPAQGRDSSLDTHPLTAAERDRYTLTARLIPERNQVEARATLVWRNRSSQALTHLLFHLYANAFADEGTVFMREAGNRLRGTRLKRRGGIDLRAMRMSDGTDLLAHADSTLVPNDATQLRVELQSPLPPGAVVQLELDFTVRLPSIVARMGAERDFFMLGQWFPKLAKLEPDGRWASFPYHGLGEFYADFSDYELQVEVPEGYVIAAPGTLLERTRPSERTRAERYLLRDALDVAWASAPVFERWSTTHGPFQIDVFSPPGYSALAREQAELVGRDLAILSERLGPYPYARLVLVMPPGRAIGAAGMEYPGLIVGWPLDLPTSINPWARELLGLVSTHELAHQWFAILLASHEVETPVLDEGFAQWAGQALMARELSRPYFSRLLGIPLDLFELTRLGLSTSTPSSLRPAPSYSSRQLGAAVYQRPALVLETIARSWGRERLWATLGRYARAHRFGHPTLHDLYRAFDDGYWPGFAERILKPALEGSVFATRLEPAASAAPGRLQARQLGQHALPEGVERVTASGTRERLAWPAERPEFTLPEGSPRTVSVDAERHNLLDPERSDDQWRGPDAAPPDATGQRLTLLAQVLLMWIGL